MAFQFLCPQGHMLQGEESQAGQQCACPYCKTLFVVPQPMIRPAPAPQPAPMPQPMIPQYLPPQPVMPQPVMPQPVAHSSMPPPLPIPQPVVPQESQEVASADEYTSDTPTDFLSARRGPAPIRRPTSALPTRPTQALPAVLHVLCPNGHSLETPRDMLGQDAICPDCDAEFRLCYETSLEYRKEKEAQEEEEAIEEGNVWMNFSIIAAVVVILGIIFLIVLSQQ